MQESKIKFVVYNVMCMKFCFEIHNTYNSCVTVYRCACTEESDESGRLGIAKHKNEDRGLIL